MRVATLLLAVASLALAVDAYWLGDIPRKDKRHPFALQSLTCEQIEGLRRLLRQIIPCFETSETMAQGVRGPHSASTRT